MQSTNLSKYQYLFYILYMDRHSCKTHIDTKSRLLEITIAKATDAKDRNIAKHTYMYFEAYKNVLLTNTSKTSSNFCPIFNSKKKSDGKPKLLNCFH